MRVSPQDNSGFSFSSSEISNLFSGSANARDSRTPPGVADAAPSATASALHAKATWGKTLKRRCMWRQLTRGKYKKENTKIWSVPGMEVLVGTYNPRYQHRVSMYEERRVQ